MTNRNLQIKLHNYNQKDTLEVIDYLITLGEEINQSSDMACRESSLFSKYPNVSLWHNGSSWQRTLKVSDNYITFEEFKRMIRPSPLKDIY